MISVRETDLGNGSYEQRYTLDVLGYEMHFVRRPIEDAPPENTVCFVDEGPRTGVVPRPVVGTYRAGEWKGVRITPTHWVTLDQDRMKK